MKNWVNGLPLISTEMYSMPCCTMRTWAARGTVSRMAHRTGFMATVQHTARRCGNPCNQYRDVVVGISVEQLHRFECRVVLGVLRFGKKSDLDRIGTFESVIVGSNVSIGGKDDATGEGVRFSTITLSKVPMHTLLPTI